MLKVMPYRASILTVNGNDPFANNVLSLMKFEAAPLADEVAGNAWTLNGSTVDTVTKKFGSSSGFFQGTTGALANNSLFTLNGADFTLDFFCYTSSQSPADRYIFDNGSNNTFLIAVRGGSSLQLLVGNTWYNMGITVPLSTWFHLAVCRMNSMLYVFLDGVLRYSHPSAFTSNISSANNIRIGGTGAGTGYAFIGYIDEFRFTKGVARYLANFPIVQNAFDKNQNNNIDGMFGQTIGLIHGTGVNGGTTFTDVKGHTLTRSGNTSLITTSTEAPRFSGASCIKFNQTAGVQPTGLQFSSPGDFVFTGDFTIEAWVQLKSFANSATACDNIIWSTGKPSGSDATYDMRFEIGGDGTYKGKVSLRSLSTGYIVIGSTVLTEGMWYHVAICRIGSTCYVFVNGNLDGTGTSSAQWGHATNTVYVGMSAYDAATRFSGYMSDLRITKGRCRYVRPFIPLSPLLPENPLGTVTAWQNLTKPAAGGIGSGHQVRITGSGFLDVTSFSVNADSYVFSNVIVESDTSIVCTAPTWPWPASSGLWHFKKPSASGNNTTWLTPAVGSISAMPVGTDYN